MTAERPGTVFLGRPGGLPMLGFAGVCRVQVCAAIFLLLLSEIVFEARTENDFSLVSHPLHNPIPDPLGLSMPDCTPGRGLLNPLSTAGLFDPDPFILSQPFPVFRPLASSSFELLHLLNSPPLSEVCPALSLRAPSPPGSPCTVQAPSFAPYSPPGSPSLF